MQNISYAKAFVSCLPVVGGGVGELLFDVYMNADDEAGQDHSIIAIVQDAMESTRALIENNRGSSDISNLEATLSSQELEVQNLKDLSIKKTRIYSICGLVSNVLTFALAVKVGIVFFSILAAVVCTFGFMYHIYNYCNAAENLESELAHYTNPPQAP